MKERKRELREELKDLNADKRMLKMKDLNERQKNSERGESTGMEKKRKKRQKEGTGEIFYSQLLTWCQLRLSGLEKHIRDLFAL